MLDAYNHFSTKLEHTLAPDQSSATFRVLDPACGSGNFLAAVARRLVAYGKQAHFSQEQLSTWLQQSLWGFDPDPVACLLAEMQVRTILAEHDLSPAFLHVHQADGLAFPWHEQQECVDLFLANPPYLASKNNDLSLYQSAGGRGQVDSYLLFLDLALRVVRPEGWVGMVLPDALLARANATRERRLLLHETTIHALWHLSGVFPAYVGAVVLIAQKKAPSPLHVVEWKREKWYKNPKRRTSIKTTNTSVSQALLQAQEHSELRYLLGTNSQSLLARLYEAMRSRDTVSNQTPLKPLGTFVTLKRGEELGKGSELVAGNMPVQTYLPLLRGGVDVQPYRTPYANYWLARTSITKPLARYLAPKLLVVKSTGQLQATLDTHGHVVLQTLYLLSVRQKRAKTIETVHNEQDEQDLDLLYYLLALLNSDLLRNYVYVLYTAYKLVQPQIEQHVLASLPIPSLSTLYYTEIVQQAKAMMDACDACDNVIEWKQKKIPLHADLERAILAMYQHALS